MNVPKELKYTKSHEWLKVVGEIGIIGITDFAQSQLGEVVFVEVNTVGEEIDKESVFGTIEAHKAVSDVFMPVKGEVLEFNQNIDSNPDLVNTDPHGEGWIIKIRIINLADIDSLLTAEEYENHIK